MRRRLLPASVFAGIVAAALALGSVGAIAQGSASPAASTSGGGTSGGAATPEDAVAAYVRAIADGDVDGILAASAVEEMAAGFDFQAYAERLRAMTPVIGMAPAEYPMFADMNRYQQASWILGQVRNLAYGLLSGEEIDGTVIAPVDAEQIAAFVAAVDPSRLAGLTVEEVRLPQPDVTTSERYLTNSAAQAAVYGADEQTERLALVSLDGRTYAIGATLLRYGDVWKVANQTSAIGGTSPLGTALPMTPEEYDSITSG